MKQIQIAENAYREEIDSPNLRESMKMMKQWNRSKSNFKHEANYLTKKQKAINKARFPIIYEKAKIGEANDEEI